MRNETYIFHDVEQGIYLRCGPLDLGLAMDRWGTRQGSQVATSTQSNTKQSLFLGLVDASEKYLDLCSRL